MKNLWGLSEMGKVLLPTDALNEINKAKLENKQIGLCCGGYDLLHPGHIMHFESAKKFCDVLVVAITCDKYVNKRKGKGRPVFNEYLRAYSVSQIVPVDYAIVCPYETAIEFIHLFKPDCYIKGSDYVNNTEPNLLLEKQAIESVGGKMQHTLDQKLSTTDIIKYIKDKL